tara:strand:+ start:3808 stop:5010 length:1203 start_codon:yes stop_codon:yes gene_type:complete
MDAHTDTAVAEAPAVTESPAAPEAVDPVADLPNASEEPASFTDALDAALAKMEQPQTEGVSAPEPTPEPTTEEPKANVEQVGESKEAENNNDPLENLSEDIGDDWTPKAASRFRQLKEELKTNRSEVEELRQTIKEQASKMQEMSGLVENRDIDQLQEKVASYEQEKVFSDLESTDAYKQAVTEPLHSLLNQANEIADKYEADADALIDAIALSDADQQDAAIESILPSASDRDKSRIYRVIEDIGPVLHRRQQLIENADVALQEAQLIEEQRRSSEAAEKAELRTNVTRNVVNRVNEKLPFLSGVEGLDMNAIQTKAAETDPSVVHPVDFAYNAVAAQLLPVIVREYIASQKETDVLTNKLAEYEGAEPTMSGTPAADGTKRSSSDLSFADAITAALGS